MPGGRVQAAANLQAASGQQQASGSQTVSVAPAVQLINGVDDLDPHGNCQAEIQRYCTDLTPGQGEVAGAACCSCQRASCVMTPSNAAELNQSPHMCCAQIACRTRLHSQRLQTLRQVCLQQQGLAARSRM